MERPRVLTHPVVYLVWAVIIAMTIAVWYFAGILAAAVGFFALVWFSEWWVMRFLGRLLRRRRSGKPGPNGDSSQD